MSKLDFIVSAIFHGGVQSMVAPLTIRTPVLSEEKGKQQIKDLFVELIGEDEISGDVNPQPDNLGTWERNDLRAELRKKMAEL